MKRVELLRVIERFQLSGIGLAIAPDFPVPVGWKNQHEKILVATPTEEFETIAQVNMTHFNIRDINVDVDKRWRVVVSLPDVLKEHVSIGSKFTSAASCTPDWPVVRRPNKMLKLCLLIVLRRKNTRIWLSSKILTCDWRWTGLRRTVQFSHWASYSLTSEENK